MRVVVGIRRKFEDGSRDWSCLRGVILGKKRPCKLLTWYEVVGLNCYDYD